MAMKKITISCLLVFSTLSSLGQSSWGITGGKLFNNFYNPKAKIISNSSNESFTAGLFYQKPVCSRSNLYVSLSYEDKTTTEPNVSGNRYFDRTTTNLNYLTIEVSNYINIKKFSWGGGLYYSSLLSSYRSITNNESQLTFAAEPADATSYDAGITTGIRYNITDRLNVYSKLNMGFIKLTTYRDGDERFITCSMGMPDPDFWYNAQFVDGKLKSFYNRSLSIGINYALIK